MHSFNTGPLMRGLLAAAVLLAAGSAALAQTPADIGFLTAQNRPFPGTSPPFVPTNYANSTVSSNGLGFALSGTGGGGISFVWGNPFAPTKSGSSFYLFGTDMSPSATLLGTTALGTDGTVLNAASNGLRLFHDTTTIAETGTAVPAALTSAAGSGSANYGDLLSTLVFAGDRPVYRATLREGGAAANTDHLLVRGLPDGTPQVLVQNSQLFPGAPVPTPGPAAVGVTRRAYFPNSTSHSRAGDNWMTKVYLERGGDITSSNDQLMVKSGQALTVGANIVQLRSDIDAPWARENEIWLALNNTAINSSGSWALTAQGFQLGTAGSQQRIFVRDGELMHRESDIVTFEGVDIRLGNNIGQVAMNESGDWALPWVAQRVDTGASVDVLLVNGEVIAATGLSTFELDGTTRPLSFLHMTDGRIAITERDASGFVDVFFGSFADGQNAYFTATTLIPEPGALSLLGLGLLALRRRRGH